MAENKTQRTKASVADFLAAIPDPHRQRDCQSPGGLDPKGHLVRARRCGAPALPGMGRVTYEGRSGRAVDWFPVGFSPRKAALVLYLMGGLKANANLLAELGPHKVGGGMSLSPRLEAGRLRGSAPHHAEPQRQSPGDQASDHQADRSEARCLTWMRCEGGVFRLDLLRVVL